MNPIFKPNDHIRGLDSIRFICAFWVFFGHGAAPVFSNPFAEGSLANLAFRGVLGNIWPGPAAVIVFFVISGFCIHYPFAGSDKRPRLKEFYTRRFIRLLVPVSVAIPLSELIGVHLTLFQQSILWSLTAELIYYILYPLLRNIHLRFGSWYGIVTVAFVVGFAVAATDPSAGNYPSYGIGLNWLLGLPCWLLGCMIAERVKTAPPPQCSTSTIWIWRMSILGVACACSVLRFHSPFGYPWTLNLFAIMVAVWLLREIAFRQHNPPSAFFEWAGSWSYSLYLIHVPASALFSAHFSSERGFSFSWALMVFFVFFSCYVFYLLIESPSHMLARRTAKKFRPPMRASEEYSLQLDTNTTISKENQHDLHSRH
ncbi:MAG: acyltransferase [Methylovulum miyakonense]|uniref:acyltransferase family protein n=1 Tax=Methylovulum miyakonense TaxID=645578 RepID=UPI003BB49848